MTSAIQSAPIVVVSGLPRSGTSMLMRMLQQGGMAIVQDRHRPADQDNPKGYFELEQVKRLGREEADLSWLEQAPGRAVKVVSPLLKHLPASHRYRVLFVSRSLQEVLQSQAKMLARRGKPYNPDDDRALFRHFVKHLDQVRAWLELAEHMEVCHLSYPEVVQAPGPQAARIVEFLGLPLDTERMSQAVDASLYRNRATTVD